MNIPAAVKFSGGPASDSFLKPGRWQLAVSFLILVATLYSLPAQWGRYKESTRRVENVRAISKNSLALLSALKDAETGQRGYLLTHDSSYLAPYQASVLAIPQLLQRLQRQSQPFPYLSAEYRQLEDLVNQKLEELHSTLSLASAERFSFALAEVRTGRGQSLMNQTRELADAISQQQATEFSKWSTRSERLSERTLLFVTGSVALQFCFLLGATWSARRAQERERHWMEAERASHEALQESETRFRSLADSAPVMIWSSDVHQKCDYFNKGWLLFTGRSMEQEIGDGWVQNLHPDDLSAYLQHYSAAFKAQSAFEQEFRLRRADGTYRWVLGQAIPRYQGNRRFVGYIGSCVDIHERKTGEEELERRVQERTEQLHYKEQELMQSRKIEAIGRLAGGVAHDFNNLLTGIFGIAEEIRDELEPDDAHRRGMEEILKAAQRAGHLTKQLLAFGRRQIVAPVVLDLNGVLKEMAGMLKRLIGEDIQLITLLDSAAGSVRMDPGQVEQIVINLVLNARDALTQGGKITVETANVELDQTYAKKHFDVTTGSYVLLAISDTGAGMDENTMNHAFEPFFTTKEKGKGSGMGLATVYGIVKQNNGDIFLYSTPGAGTTFKIYLPRINQVAPAAAAPASPHKGGHETILLVEDEDIVRRMSLRALTRAGYKVLEASHGKEALEISASYQETIHLLLTDVIMPGLNGRQVAELLQPQRPSMKVLYMSGYTENIIAQRGMLKPGIAFLEKSFTANALCRKVRDVLDLTPPE